MLVSFGKNEKCMTARFPRNNADFFISSRNDVTKPVSLTAMYHRCGLPGLPSSSYFSNHAPSLILTTSRRSTPPLTPQARPRGAWHCHIICRRERRRRAPPTPKPLHAYDACCGQATLALLCQLFPPQFPTECRRVVSCCAYVAPAQEAPKLALVKWSPAFSPEQDC